MALAPGHVVRAPSSPPRESDLGRAFVTPIMRLPTQILLLGALLHPGARAQVNASDATPATDAGTPPAAAPAADADVVELAAMRVTADLWETPFERLPASVSIYEGAALQRGGVRHFGDLADQVANLTWTGGTSRPRYFQIRGVGENSQYEGETPDSAVAFKVDDLDFTGLGGLGSTFDVRQVEVLRGPQAGAFGANAAGGIVQIVTNDPTPVAEGFVSGTVGNDSLREAGVAYGGTLTEGAPETLMFRIAAQHSESDGFRRNRTLDRDTNARDEDLARLKLTWNPNRLWRWDAGLLWSRQDNGFDEFALDNNGRYTYSDQPGRDEQDALAGSLRGTYLGWDEVRLTTITTATRADSLYSYDDDWTAASYAGFSELNRERRVFTQELRLDGETDGFLARWTLGSNWAGNREDTVYTNEDPGNLRGLATDYQADNQALFAQGMHEIGTSTRATLGLRLEQVASEGNGLRTRFRKGPGTFDPPRAIAPSYDDVLPGGKLTLEHDLAEQHLVFASVARGYKAGGINVDARIDPATDPLTYDTETLWNYELGARSRWLEQRLTSGVSVFYTDRRDAQVRDSAGFGGNYRFFTDNAERASVYGLEGELRYALTERWSARGTLGLMQSDLDTFTLSNGNTGGGRRLANTPPYGYTLGVAYRAPRGWFGDVEWVGRAEQYDSNNQNEARSAFSVVNTSLGYDWGSWTLTLWARNLLDEDYEKRVFFFGNEDPDYIFTRYETRADPRQIGITASYAF